MVDWSESFGIGTFFRRVNDFFVRRVLGQILINFKSDSSFKGLVAADHPNKFMCRYGMWWRLGWSNLQVFSSSILVAKPWRNVIALVPRTCSASQARLLLGILFIILVEMTIPHNNPVLLKTAINTISHIFIRFQQTTCPTWCCFFAVKPALLKHFDRLFANHCHFPRLILPPKSAFTSHLSLCRRQALKSWSKRTKPRWSRSFTSKV